MLSLKFEFIQSLEVVLDSSYSISDHSDIITGIIVMRGRSRLGQNLEGVPDLACAPHSSNDIWVAPHWSSSDS